MALSQEELSKLPPSIQRLLANSGDLAPLTPSSDAGNPVLRDLQGALGRRFGQQYGAEFDPEYDAGVRGLLGQVPQHQAAFANRRQRIGEDFYRSAEDLDRMNNRANESHEIQMADRGLLRSGANLVGAERLGEQFQRGVQGLGQARTRSLTDLTGEEAGTYQRIRSRQSELEAAGTERARVREEKKRWEEEQRRMEEERLRREEQYRQEELASRQAEQAAAEARLREVEAAALSAAQPMPGPTGGYSGGGGGGGGPAQPQFASATIDYNEFDTKNADQVRELQNYLNRQYNAGIPVDGSYGPATDAALRRNRGFVFNDRAANFHGTGQWSGGGRSAWY